MDFQQKVQQFIRKHHMLEYGSGIIVGLSGGADSVALLEVLCSMQEILGLRLAAVHVHHGIRAEAEEDAAFCRELCEKKQVPLYVEYVKVPEMAAEQGISVEEAGRRARYLLFEQYRKHLAYDRIAVAHHQNDQAETMLFQMFRGSGLKGLAGMPVIRDCVIRPLLGVSREEIEVYLTEQGLSYVTDSTNAEDAYTRNKIRHHVLPVAEEVSAGAVEHMNRAGQQLREVLEYMEQQVEAFLDAHAKIKQKNGYESVLSENFGALKRDAVQEQEIQEIRIPILPLLSQHIALQKMIVLTVIDYAHCGRKDITERHVFGILGLLEKEGEKEIHLPKGLCVRKDYDNLIFINDLSVYQKELGCRQENITSEKSQNQKDVTLVAQPKVACIRPNCQYRLENGQILCTRLFAAENIANILENIPKSDCIKWLDYDKIKGVLSLRTREQGDFLMLRTDGGQQFLQDYFINEKIPRSHRDQILLLADGSHIVWVPGKRISAYYKITNETKQILEVYIGGNKDG